MEKFKSYKSIASKKKCRYLGIYTIWKVIASSIICSGSRIKGEINKIDFFKEFIKNIFYPQCEILLYKYYK